MSINENILNSEPVNLLCRLYTAEYSSQDLPVPSMLNALGACAGFAAQVAVWRDLILPRNRNPGDFLVFATTKSRENYFFGDATNLFLLATTADRLSFLSLAAATLRNASELPDIGDVARYVAKSVGAENFGQPRIPPGIDLPELPRAALTRTWQKAAHILRDCPAAEWPALFGAAAGNIISANRQILAPLVAVKLLLEAAVPMSKLNPVTVEHSGVPAPLLTDWSNRALRPENSQEIQREILAAMPAMPRKINARPITIAQPTIGFANLAGASCDAIVTQDSVAFGDLFHGRIRVVTASIPVCDILFLYCNIEPSGRVVGYESPLRDLIGKSGAAMAVIASEVAPDTSQTPEFNKTLARGNNPPPPVNLVVTFHRNGEVFSRFFKSLLELMLTGVPMPMAWVTLAPQGPLPSEDCPVTICIPEAGGVVFGKGT
jgi:hypothetical protein